MNIYCAKDYAELNDLKGRGFRKEKECGDQLVYETEWGVFYCDGEARESLGNALKQGGDVSNALNIFANSVRDILETMQIQDGQADVYIHLGGQDPGAVSASQSVLDKENKNDRIHFYAVSRANKYPEEFFTRGFFCLPATEAEIQRTNQKLKKTENFEHLYALAVLLQAQIASSGSLRRDSGINKAELRRFVFGLPNGDEKLTDDAGFSESEIERINCNRYLRDFCEKLSEPPVGKNHEEEIPRSELSSILYFILETLKGGN